MRERDIQDMLRTAIEHTAPDEASELLARTEEGSGRIVLIREEKRRNGRWTAGLIAACLALMLVAGAGIVWQRDYAVTSVVSLDVNPSIELRVNRRQRVLACEARNEDAVPILADMDGGADLKGAKLEVAVNALVGSLLRGGYLDSLSSTLLITVEDDNAERGQRLQEELRETAANVLENATVLSMSMTRDDALDALAAANDISDGKAAYVEQVRALNEELDFASLAALTMEELRYVMESGGEKTPIGKEEAAGIAAEYAGITELSDVRLDIDLEFSRGGAFYEVEMEHPAFGEREYRVDALTGQVLRGEENILAPAPTPALPSSAAGAAPVEAPPLYFEDDDDRDDDDDWDDDRDNDDDWDDDLDYDDDDRSAPAAGESPAWTEPAPADSEDDWDDDDDDDGDDDDD